MSRRSVALILMLILASSASSVLCADIAGTVLDAEGNRVQGVRIAALQPTGQPAGKAVTDAGGYYRITHLEPSTYDFALDPGGTPFQPGTAVAFVGKEGLTINWRASQATEASAMAARGANTAAPIPRDAFGLIVDGVAGAGMLTGYAAGSGFGSASPPSPPPSPSM